MDYKSRSREELIALCKEKGIKGYSGKKKNELVDLLSKTVDSTETSTGGESTETSTIEDGLSRLTVRSTGATRNALSLFSGAGGDTCGLEAAGWTVTHFSEFNNHAIQTHENAFPTSKLLKTKESTDIKKIPDEMFAELKGAVDLIFAGFPCQGFSHAGKKREDDPRNELVHEFARAARIIQPEWIIGENVKGLLSRKGVYPADTPARPIIEIIHDIFEEIGYKITYRVIDVREVGVPQLRKRLIIVGHRGTLYPHVPWDEFLAIPETLGIRHILKPTLADAMELPALYKPQEQAARFWIETTETAPSGKPHPNLERLVAGKRNLTSKEKKDAKLPENAKVEYIEKNGLISFGVRKSGYHGQVLDPDAPSKTIICAYTQCPRLFVGLYNPKVKKYWVRCLTYEECAQIQGFPIDYPWQGALKDKIVQIGNAVPPPLASTMTSMLEKTTFHSRPQVVAQAPAPAHGRGGDTDSSDEDD